MPKPHTIEAFRNQNPLKFKKRDMKNCYRCQVAQNGTSKTFYLNKKLGRDYDALLMQLILEYQQFREMTYEKWIEENNLADTTRSRENYNRIKNQTENAKELLGDAFGDLIAIEV